MDKTELKRLSKKWLRSESRYAKMMEGVVVSIPYDGMGAMPTSMVKRYTQEEIEDFFNKAEKEEAEQKERERLEKLADSVRGITRASNL